MPRRAPVFAAKHPLVFAHRGGAKLAPENTLPAFANGLALGADGLEIDVQLSADGIPVAIHDQTLERTTDCSGPVAGFPAAELEHVDAGYRFEQDGRHPYRGQGIGIPRLDEVLDTHRHARVIIEMKGGQPQLARAVGAAIRKADAVWRTCVGSFYQASIDAMRAEFPEVTTSASQEEARWTLHRSWVRWPWMKERPYFAFQVPEHAGRMRVVSPAFLRHVHREGHAVQVWVVNERDDIQRLLDWGIDGIISDRPDIAVATRNAWLVHRSLGEGRPQSHS
ncbi:MAG: glycerophosphodiester phosphodiesterase [Vicinamibacterales bacterium]